MISIRDILRPRHVDLTMGQLSENAAILHVTNLLRNDDRVTDWTAFYQGIRSRNPCVAGGQEFEICIPHARTDAVSGMVMSAARCLDGIEICGKKVHYIFVIGVPVALAADYLRIIGALARIFRDPAAERELRAVQDSQSFVELLSEREMRL